MRDPGRPLGGEGAGRHEHRRLGPLFDGEPAAPLGPHQPHGTRRTCRRGSERAGSPITRGHDDGVGTPSLASPRPHCRCSRSQRCERCVWTLQSVMPRQGGPWHSCRARSNCSGRSAAKRDPFAITTRNGVPVVVRKYLTCKAGRSVGWVLRRLRLETVGGRRLCQS